MPFEVRRSRDKGKVRQTWVLLHCVATAQEVMCPCRNYSGYNERYLKFHFDTLKSKIPELLRFLERHRAPSDPSPCDLLLQLFPVQHQMLNRALLGLAQRELIKAARGQS